LYYIIKFPRLFLLIFFFFTYLFLALFILCNIIWGYFLKITRLQFHYISVSSEWQIYSDRSTNLSSNLENLSNYEEIEWYQFQQLTEGITMQPTGAREAIEAVRKKLKHGTTEQKLRVLEVSAYSI
jgi:isocitrate dehydrogenase